MLNNKENILTYKHTLDPIIKVSHVHNATLIPL